jgi:beta-lactamase superfamily II metal-dependent hydrolase
MQSGKLIVHFLNVGHGDCTVIKHPSNRITVIDSSNGEAIDEQRAEATLRALRKDYRVFQLLRARGVTGKAALKQMGASVELTNPVEFIARMYPNLGVFRYIQTHPEMDHMRGLAALLDHQDISAFWDTENDRDDDMRDSDQADWEAYCTMRKDNSRRVFVRGNDNAFYGSANEYDKIDILAPTTAWTAECNKNEKWNDMSIVVRVTHNGASFVFGGDAESPAWDNMMADPIVKAKLKNINVLKASHHGRVSGYDEKAVTWMSPSCVVMSIGEDCEHEAIEHYEKHTKLVLSTYDCGDITMTVDEVGKVTYQTSHAKVA